MPRTTFERIANYRTGAGHRRALWCRRLRDGWECKFSGYGLGKNARPFRAATPEGLVLLASIRAHLWGGSWSQAPGARFPSVAS